MVTIYDICKQIAKDTNRDYDEICRIARYEFAITKNIMKSDNNYKDILFNNFIRFKLKSRFQNNKTQKYTSK